MKITRASLVLGIALVLAGCASQSDKPVPTTAPSAAVSGVPVNKYCIVDPTDRVDPAITCVYNGVTYGFCCPDCRKEFRKNPSKYLANAK